MSDSDQISTFNERFRAAVKYGGGASEVARKSGISLGSLNSYLKSSEPTAFKAFKLADACNVSCRWLSTGEGAMVDRFNNILLFSDEIFNSQVHYFGLFMAIRIAREYHERMNLKPTLAEIFEWIGPYYIGQMSLIDARIEFKSPVETDQ